jgi:c-di-GMP-binding flagellar brake protein YcgR
MENSEFKDKRNFERTSIVLSVHYFCSYTYKWGLAQTRDVSTIGVGLVIETELSPGFALEMWITIPNQDQFFYARGDVVWSKEVEPHKYKVGIKLHEEHPAGILQVLGTA